MPPLPSIPCPQASICRRFGSQTYEATGRTVQSAPEAISYTFNDLGKCTSYTGGAFIRHAALTPL